MSDTFFEKRTLVLVKRAIFLVPADRESTGQSGEKDTQPTPIEIISFEMRVMIV